MDPPESIAHYRITAKLGEGGMGAVYRATDTRLGRDVALKFLSSALAGDADYMARFQREASVLASLNHPNIATIHGIEESAGTRAIVMELVEGPTLADVISRGPMPVEEAVPIARQIAEAFEAAHEKSIIHRDLKPANVKITPQGVVKVLDFGLAKALDHPARDAASSPTLTMRATLAGTIMGTAAYMSPEQASGKPVDRRADIWAFGVVLLEMLTGKQLFTGDTAAETLASVIKEPIAIDRLPASTPPAVRQLIARCLERDVRRRLQHIGEARIALEGPFQIAPETKAAAPKRFVRAVAAGGALLLLALAALGWLHLRESSPHLPTIRFQVQLPEKWAAASFQISPDGRYLAMTNSDAVLQHSRLWIRPLDGLEATALSGTEGASYPFWSPDSASLAFFAGGKLKRIAVSGGPPQIICDAPGSRGGGTWGRDGTILFVATLNHFSLVTAAGGAPADVPAAIAGEQRRFPRFLPDGRHFLYVRTASGPSGDGVYVASLDAGAPIRLLPGTASAWFVPADAAPSGGYLLFRQQGALMAQAFDVKRFKLSGPAIPVADRVGAEFTYRNTSYSASDTGVLVYTALIEGNKELVWLDRSGKQIQTAGPTGVYNNFRLSPDGVNVAFDRSETEIGSSDIWALDTRRQIASRLTSDPAVENLPIWSPDGLRLVFPSNRSGTFDLYSKAATGTGQEELVIKLGTPTGWGTDWSRDGRFILYQMPGETTGQDLWVAPQFGDRKPYPYLHTQFNEQDGKFSPDGRWIAYVSDESGRDEIYVQSFPLSGEKRRISAAGGIVPSWRKDGAELFYLGSDRNLVAVPIQIGKTVNAGVPKALFPLPESARRNSYAASDDGQRFLVARSVGDDPPLTVVVNWQAALKK